MVVQQTLTPTLEFPKLPTQTIQIIKKKENVELSIHLVRHVAKLIIPKRNVTLEQMQRTDRLPGTADRKDKIKPNSEIPKATQMAMSKLQPKF